MTAAETADRPARALAFLTFNTWLVRALGFDLARDVDRRAALIPSEAAATGADVVALQEVWSPALADRLASGFRSAGYDHIVRGPARRGMVPRLGDGLLVASKLPLLAPRRAMSFSRASVWYEAFIRKGGLYARLALPWGPSLDLFTAHLGVVRYRPRRKEFRKSDTKARTEQVRELIGWIQETRSAQSDFLILLGDLNVHDHAFAAGAYLPDLSAEYRALTDDLELVDTYRVTNAAEDGAWTFDPTSNPYAATGDFKRLPPERIDYVFVRRDRRVRVVSSQRVFGDAPTGGVRDGSPPRLSDHYGVLTRVAFEG